MHKRNHILNIICEEKEQKTLFHYISSWEMFLTNSLETSKKKETFITNFKVFLFKKEGGNYPLKHYDFKDNLLAKED